MHIDDAHDDKMVAEETALQVHTGAQAQAEQAVSAIIEPPPSNPSPDLTTKSVDHLTESHMPSRSAHASTRAA